MSKGPARKQAAEWVAQSIERVALLAQAFSSAHRSAEALLQLETLDRHAAPNIRQGQAVETGDARSAVQMATQKVSNFSHMEYLHIEKPSAEVCQGDILV